MYCVCSLCMYVCLYKSVHVCERLFVCVCVCMCVCVCVCVYNYMCICKYVNRKMMAAVNSLRDDVILVSQTETHQWLVGRIYYCTALYLLLQRSD